MELRKLKKNNFKLKLKPINLLYFIGFISLIVTLTNINLFINRYKIVGNLFSIGIDFVLVYIYCFLFFALFSFSKLILKTLFIIIMITNSIAGYYIHNFKIIIDEIMISTVLSTDIQETQELITFDLIFKVLFITLISIFIVFYPLKKTNHKSYIKNFIYSFKYFFIILFIYIILRLIPNPVWYNRNKIKDIISQYMPYNYIRSALIYNDNLKNIKNLEKKEIDILYNYNDDEIDDDLKIVLIIGEAARSDKFSLNGYKRNTNPMLSKVNNLISFKNAYSCSTLTKLSIQCILSRLKYPKDFTLQINEKSLISIFKKLAFRTYWFSNQTRAAESIYNIALEADITKFYKYFAAKETLNKNIYDEILITEMEKYLNKEKKQVFVLHTKGSHYSYDMRYPNKFREFTPICTAKTDKMTEFRSLCKDFKKINNSYDNSILYTDYVIYKAIQKLKDKNAILIYISDHGESLGENGRFAHGAPIETAPKEQIHIPFILWTSNKFKNKNLFNKIKSKENKKINQYYIFHSLLDCIGVKSNIINKKLSLCN